MENKDSNFLGKLSYKLIDTSKKNIIKDIALPEIKKYTKASYAHFSVYDENEKGLKLEHIEADSKILNTIIKVGGKKIFSTITPLSTKNSKLIKSFDTKVLTSITDLSFGTISQRMDTNLKKITGFNYFFCIPQVHSKKLYGVTVLAFKKESELPNPKLLKSYSNILSLSLKKYTAEQNLLESERKYKALVENANDIIYSLNPEGFFTYVSPNWKEILGHKIEEVKGEHFSKFAHPEDIKKCEEFLQKVLKTKKRQSGVEYRVKHKNGNLVWHTSNASPLINEQGGVTSFIGITRDITKQKEKLEEIAAVSFKDELTGLYNRRFFNMEMKRLNKKRQLPLSIITADINGLKLINDTYGHEIGDQLIKCGTKVLKDACREEDIIARWGGDEFLILLPQTSKKETEKIIRRITRFSLNHTKTCPKKQKLPISIALGSSTKTRPEQTIQEILKISEDNMYTHKLTLKSSQRNLLIQSLINTLTAKGFEESHINNMKKQGKVFGKKLGFGLHKLNQLETLINLHDIGKVHIPEKILITPQKLSKEELELVKEHPAAGYRITRAIENLGHLSEDILSHHEKWDGTGYPRKLKGTHIPYLARVISILDAYEVMNYGRPYRKAKNKKQIISEFKKEAGKQFDPELTKIFVKLLEENKI